MCCEVDERQGRESLRSVGQPQSQVSILRKKNDICTEASVGTYVEYSHHSYRSTKELHKTNLFNETFFFDTQIGLPTKKKTYSIILYKLLSPHPPSWYDSSSTFFFGSDQIISFRTKRWHRHGMAFAVRWYECPWITSCYRQFARDGAAGSPSRPYHRCVTPDACTYINMHRQGGLGDRADPGMILREANFGDIPRPSH